MRNKQQILALVLVAAMIFALTGCSGGGGGSSVDSSSPTNVTYDFGGETVTIIDQYDDMLLNTDEHTLARYEQVEKDFNVNIEIIPPKGNYGTAMIASIISGSPAGHILSGRDTNVADWARAGVFADLTAAMEKTGIDFMDEKVYDPIVTRYTNINNQQLCFGKRHSTAVGGLWMFNKRIFAEMNLENPYELYKKGEWTWDKVEELATKATIRKSDGTVTQWGLATYMAMPLVMDMVLTNGGRIAGFDDKGKPAMYLNDPKTVEALERFNTWMNVKQILRTNDGTEVWDTVYKEFPNGNIAIFAGNALSYAVEANMKDEYGIVGAPKANADTEYMNPVNGYRMWFIPKTYESQADRYIALMNALWQPFEGVSDADMLTDYYAENLYDKESLQMIIDLKTKPLPTPFDASQMFNLEWVSPSLYNLVGELMAGETPGSLAEKYQTSFLENANYCWEDMTLTGK